MRKGPIFAHSIRPVRELSGKQIFARIQICTRGFYLCIFFYPKMMCFCVSALVLNGCRLFISKIPLLCVGAYPLQAGLAVPGRLNSQRGPARPGRLDRLRQGGKPFSLLISWEGDKNKIIKELKNLSYK